VKLVIEVVPGASIDGIVGRLDDVLKVRVTANAEKGKKNQAVVKVMAKALAVPGERVMIVSGAPRVR